MTQEVIRSDTDSGLQARITGVFILHGNSMDLIPNRKLELKPCIQQGLGGLGH
jgi:hypothetical protein